MHEEVKQAITQLGLEYRLMTQFTSFVAVEEMIVTDGGQPRRIDVPVEVPEGVNRAGVFGQENEKDSIAYNGRGQFANTPMPMMARQAMVSRPTTSADKTKTRRSGGGGGGGLGSGSGNNVGPPPKTIVLADEAIAMDGTRAPSPEEQKRRQLAAKFHPTVLAVIDRLKDTKSSPGPDEARFVRNGKAEVQIWLTEKSDETMAKLKELGLEVVLDPKSSRMVIGRLTLEKLAALSELKFVRYVAPQM